MYNNFRKGTAANWACKEAIGAMDSLESAQGEIEAVFEDILGQLEAAEEEHDDLEQENSDLRQELEDLQEKYDAIHGASDELITLLTEVKQVGKKMDVWATGRLVSMGALNESKDTDSGAGDPGAGSSQDADDQVPGETAT